MERYNVNPTLQPILTKAIADRLLKTKEALIEISFDLGKTTTKVSVTESEVLIGEQSIKKTMLAKLKDETCYLVTNNNLQQIAFFSQESNKYYKLVPTTDWPTITLSSTPMHRHTHLSPKADTRTKIREIHPIRGKILDTCCGLGYTAILAAAQAKEVHTFEKDPYVLHVAGLNPYSQELFTHKNIVLHKNSVLDDISAFQENSFDRIIHDPPTFKYAPELYAIAFHQQLYRILKKDGILYHYCPAPQKTHGKLFYPRIIKQLKEAGFTHVEYHEKSSGIRTRK